MFGFGKKKPLTAAQRKKAEKQADAIIDFFFTPSKSSGTKPGYKHKDYLRENYQKAMRDARKKRR